MFSHSVPVMAVTAEGIADAPAGRPADCSSVAPERVAAAVDAALDWTATHQEPAGSWRGILESNACMEAEWLLAFHVLGYDYPHSDALVRGILARQRADGAWESF